MSVYSGVIDDNDVGTILYSQNWELWQASNPDPKNYKSTLHSTSTPGASARVRFTGSRVAVVSTIATGSGSLSKASFSLDNGPAIPVSVATTPPVQFQYVFWDSGPLPYGSHLLVIVNMDNKAYFRIDHIDYDPTDSNSPPSSSSNVVNVGPTLSQSVALQQTPTSTVVVATTPAAFGPDVTKSGTPSGGIDISEVPLQATSAGASSDSISAQTVDVTTKSTMTSQLLSSSTSTSTSVMTTGGWDNTVVAQNSDKSHGSTGAERSMPMAAIAGGVAAVVFVIVILGLLFCFLKRRRSQKSIYLSGGGSPITVRNPTIPTPFKRRTQNLSSASLLGSTGTHSMNETSSVFDQFGSALPIIANPRILGGHSQQSSTSSNTTWRNNAGANLNARAKHAEFLAERQQAMIPSLNCPPGLPQTGIQPLSALGRLLDTEGMDAPPAYSGQVRESMGEGSECLRGHLSGRRNEV